MVEYYLIPRSGDGKTPESALPKYLDGQIRYGAKAFGEFYLIQIDLPEDVKAQLVKQGDVIALKSAGDDLSPEQLAAVKQLGLPVDSFSGKNAQDLVGFILPVIDAKAAFEGLKAQMNVAAEMRAKLPAGTPDMDAFLAEIDPAKLKGGK